MGGGGGEQLITRLICDATESEDCSSVLIISVDTSCIKNIFYGHIFRACWNNGKNCKHR